MSDRVELEKYKQQIANLYSARSASYDRGDWHPRIARRLVEYARLSPGQQVLDIATGTGMVALLAAQIVKMEGHVIGIDISTGMLERARQKLKASGLKNIEFQLADGEALSFRENHFDTIFCSSAMIWMSDLHRALRLWQRCLKPGGLLCFHAFADTAFVGGVVSQKILEKYDVSLSLNKPTGTTQKCYDLMDAAGFENIEIKSEPDGSYISLEQAKGMWIGDSSFPTPGQYPNPLRELSLSQRVEAKIEFDAVLDSLQTERGIWDDRTIFYTLGRKAFPKDGLASGRIISNGY
ncbi:methyltransferase domain-containing protein [Oscillatoriales cyanobacterium LEGE 11467]|uniref:Methyltransferase domain-containing protein n=1 Tax=Zarconia navalis LEGE 11467 TaxID=1828826 RepID=A0A928VZT3_9CYAN|nr:methyltransferase domain-containing protein [Zarconia navalis LEGE 11467]